MSIKKFVGAISNRPRLSVVGADPRVRPQSVVGNTQNVAAVVIPTNSVGFEFSVGPNPVKKSDGVVKFFVGANSVRPLLGTGNITGKLTIYDATGNVVRKIDVNKNMSWDLRDSKNRPVPSGAYLLRGVINHNGKREKISAVIGVR